MCLPYQKIVSEGSATKLQLIDALPGVNNFVEPCYLGYTVSSPALLCAVERLKEILPPDATNDYITQKCLAARVERVQKLNEAADQAVSLFSATASTGLPCSLMLVIDD